MESKPNNNDFDYFPLAATVAGLGELARDNNKQGFIDAVRMLDMTASILLRGCAYLSHCLENQDDHDEKQHDIARASIREITALCAVLLELQCDMDGCELILKSKIEGGQQHG